MIKNTIHKSIEKGLSLINFPFLQKKANINITIPFYHIVNNRKNNLISNLYSYRNEKEFEKDLDFFLKYYNVIDIPSLLNYQKGQANLPKNAALLTFDDGLREVKDIIVPILIKKGLPASFFITTDFLDNKNLFFRNKISLLINFYENNKTEINITEIKKTFSKYEIDFFDFNQNLLSLKFEQTELINELANLMNFSFAEYLKKETPYLNSSEVSDLIKQGFSIGAHSINHRLYKDTTEEEQIRQTLESVRIIREKFNLDYGIFAFPFNDEGLSANFFKEIKKSNLIDVFFSADGFLDDECKINYHRFWMESTTENAKEIVIRNMKEKFIRQLKNKNLIKR